MNIEKYLSIKTIELTGESILLFVSLTLMLQYFRILEILINVNISIGWSFLLWIYLIINVGGANIIKYLREKNNPMCPKCNKKLDKEIEYKCQEHGKLTFDKK